MDVCSMGEDDFGAFVFRDFNSWYEVGISCEQDGTGDGAAHTKTNEIYGEADVYLFLFEDGLMSIDIGATVGQATKADFVVGDFLQVIQESLGASESAAFIFGGWVGLPGFTGVIVGT